MGTFTFGVNLDFDDIDKNCLELVLTQITEKFLHRRVNDFTSVKRLVRKNCRQLRIVARRQNNSLHFWLFFIQFLAFLKNECMYT